MAKWYPILTAVWRRRLGSKSTGRHGPLTGEEIRTLTAGVTRLSRGFTGNRRLVGEDYLSDPALLGAYLLFYWPVSYAQARTVFNDLERRGTLMKGFALDIGSGPAPLSFALFDAGFDRVHAFEKIPLAVEIARELARAAGIGSERFETTVWEATGTGRFSSKRTFDIEKGTVQLAAFGHMINELGPVSKSDGSAPASTLDIRARLLADFSELLDPGGTVTIIEPALKPVTRNLLALRDLLADGGVPIKAPCFFNGPCPAFALPDQTCHGQVNWTMPDTLRRLSEAAHIDKEQLAMAWLATGPVKMAPVSDSQPDTPPHGRIGYPLKARSASPDSQDASLPWRVVSEAMLNKAGRTRFMICGREGRISLSLKRGDLVRIAELRASSPGADPAGIGTAKTTEKLFFSLSRGAVIEITNPELRENGLGIVPDSRLNRL